MYKETKQQYQVYFYKWMIFGPLKHTEAST